MLNKKGKWINEGYKQFALLGYNSIKIENLSKSVGVSKSSFYHYFVDIDIFIDYLLEHHIKQAKNIAVKESEAISISPDLINILVEHKDDLLFNKQLRFNREIDKFNRIVLESDQLIGNHFILLWKKELKTELNTTQLNGLFELALENFYLQINYDNLNHKWLSDYFHNLMSIVNRL